MHSWKLLPALAILVFTSNTTNTTKVIDVNFPAAPASNASHVPNTFMGFSIDQQALLKYSGNASHPNKFSQNLIQSLNNRTGSHSTIRIGGTFGDRVTYNASQTIKPVKMGGSKPGWSVGPSFFQGYQQFPDNQITIQMRLGKTEDLNNSLLFMQAAYKAVGANNLNAIEIGNEVSGYEDGYNISHYVSDFLKYEQALEQAIPTLPKGPIYQGCDTASIKASEGGWTPIEELKSGLNNNSRIKTIGEHYYQVKKQDGNLQDLLMNHKAIVDRFHNYTPSINYTNQHNLTYILSEVGNSLEGHEKLGFQAVLGAALWAVDLQMYAMTLGVQRVNMAQKPSGGFSLWLPEQQEDQKPEVRAPYYAQPYIADFIGKSGKTKVTNQDLQSDHLTAYAAYDGGKLSRIALVNMNSWNGTNQTTRPEQAFNVHVGSGSQSVAVERLTAPTGAHAQNNLTWAGQQWTYESMGVGVIVNKNHTEQVPVKNGIAAVNVSASEAVMVSL